MSGWRKDYCHSSINTTKPHFLSRFSLCTLFKRRHWMGDRKYQFRRQRNQSTKRPISKTYWKLLGKLGQKVYNNELEPKTYEQLISRIKLKIERFRLKRFKNPNEVCQDKPQKNSRWDTMRHLRNNFVLLHFKFWDKYFFVTR